jgi:hypothetical protein
MSDLLLGVLVATALALGATSCGSEEGHAADSATSAPQTASPVESTEATPVPTVVPAPVPTHTPTLLAPPTDEDLVRVGELFVRFAHGHQPYGPPVDTPVLLLVGGQPSKTITAREAVERSSWEGLCPDAGGYAGRSCPFSFLEPLANAKEPVAISREPAQHPCAHPTPVTPAEVGGSRLVTLVPNPGAACPAYVAVELYVNDVGQIVAANLIWSEP